jgi:hypothetical protein
MPGIEPGLLAYKTKLRPLQHTPRNTLKNDVNFIT